MDAGEREREARWRATLAARRQQLEEERRRQTRRGLMEEDVAVAIVAVSIGVALALLLAAGLVARAQAQGTSGREVCWLQPDASSTFEVIVDEQLAAISPTRVGPVAALGDPDRYGPTCREAVLWCAAFAPGTAEPNRVEVAAVNGYGSTPSVLHSGAGCAPPLPAGPLVRWTSRAARADWNQNGALDAGDLGALLGVIGRPCLEWGSAACRFDLSRSGVVDAADVGELLAAWRAGERP